MDRIKKIARLFIFICLIILAGIGIGLSGGVPLPFSQNRRQTKKEKIEQLAYQEKKSDSEQN